MNIKNISRATIVCMILAGATASAQETSVLDATEHPNSPPREEIFANKILPLDVKLSWTERFNGNETFNANERLDTGMSMMMHDDAKPMKKEMKKGGGMMDGTGVVKGIRAEQGKVKIAHGPIEKFGMPEMTMMFKVEDTAMLTGLEKDQEVGFNVENTSGGFIVTRIMPKHGMSGDMASKPGMDARGIVKSIRPSQGKVRIEHEPIEKYGMPSMTMVFKVKDPALLDGLEKGLAVEFNVDNSSGGFEITNIKPVN